MGRYLARAEYDKVYDEIVSGLAADFMIEAPKHLYSNGPQGYDLIYSAELMEWSETQGIEFVFVTRSQRTNATRADVVVNAFRFKTVEDLIKFKLWFQ